MNKQIYDKITKFAKNMRSTGGPISNIYYIRKYDENGKLINEYYGMNHMTHYGMRQYCNANKNFPTNLYIGYGNSSPFNRNTNAIVSPIMDDPITSLNTTIDYGWPLYYAEDPDGDPAKSYITCICRFMQARIAYNVPDREVRIGEYGLGNSQNELWTHSKVYDAGGNATYMTKRTNEQLDFDVFLCMTYSEKTINDAWDQGIFTVITQMNRFLDSSYHMYPQKVFTYRRGDITTNRNCTKSMNYGVTGEDPDLGENDAVFNTVVNDFELYDQDSNDQRCFSGFCEYTPGWCVLEDVQLSFTENIDILIKPDELDGVQAYTVSNYFGMRQLCPFTKLHVDHVYMFNVVPDGNGEYGYTNEVSFINDDNHDYCETPMQTSCAVSIFHEQNEQNTQMYLHMNTHPEDAITSFTNTTIGTLFATDKYWDTWTLIPNLQHIPVEHQHDRFWITKTNDVSLDPVRESPRFSYNPSCGTDTTVGYAMTAYGANTYDGYDAFDDNDPNVQYRYCVRDNVIYYPETRTYWQIDNLSSNTWHKYSGFGKWLLVFPNDWNKNNQAYLLVDVVSKLSKIVSSKLQYAYQEMADCSYITETGNGLVCVQTYHNADNSKRECLVIDLRNVQSIIEDMDQHEYYIEGAFCSCAIYGTSCVAYIPNGVHEVHVRNFDTNTEVVYAIPSDIQSSYKFMYAHSKYVWLTNGNGTAKTYLLNLDTNDESERWTLCGDRNCGLFSSDVATWWRHLHFTHVDKFFTVYRYDQISNWLKGVYYIDIDNPTFVNNNLNAMSDTTTNFNGTQHFKLRYISTTKDSITGELLSGTLAMTCSCGYKNNNSSTTGQGSCIKIFDFGAFYYNQTNNNFTVTMHDDVYPLIPYGEFYIQGTRKIPIEYGVYHRIVGTTRSVTAKNNLKHISNQMWQTYITNVLPERFDGIPQGEHR